MTPHDPHPQAVAARELARRFAIAGADGVTTYAGLIHGFWPHPALFDAAEASLAEVRDFLAHHVVGTL